MLNAKVLQKVALLKVKSLWALCTSNKNDEQEAAGFTQITTGTATHASIAGSWAVINYVIVLVLRGRAKQYVRV